MSAVAREKPLAARDALEGAIARRGECAEALDEARAAHAAAVDGLEGAKRILEAIATSERAHGLDLAAAIKLAVEKGHQVPLLPAGPDGLGRARAEGALTAANVAVSQLGAELEQATAALAAAEDDVRRAARGVLAEEAQAITIKAERAFENLRTMQAALAALDVAAFRPGGIGAGVLPVSAAWILSLDLASGSTPPGHAQAVLAAWRGFAAQLQHDADAEAPKG